MRVAIVGAGVFGCTTAVDLARAGARVDLFDARADILDGATARCQARLHRGYHYPRSDATALAAQAGFDEFADRFPAAVRSFTHHYVIAPGSRTTAADYLAFCDRLGLPYTVVDQHPAVHTADLVVRVPEAMVGVNGLRRLLRRDLAAAGVTLHLNTPVATLTGYDRTVWATYGQPWTEPLRYEVCEVALIELGRYGRDSFVVLDGDYVSLDPYGRVHALYDVKHSVHAANVGDRPELAPEYASLIARGRVGTSLSHAPDMLASAGRFLRGLDPHGRGVSIYHGSLWTVRAVLPDVDDTDERPTLVDTSGIDVRILSGKICTAPAAARAVTAAVMGLVPA